MYEALRQLLCQLLCQASIMTSALCTVPPDLGCSAWPSYADSPCCHAQPSFCRTIPDRTTEQPAFEHAILRGLDKHGHAGDKKSSKGWWKRYGVVSMHEAVLARLRNNNFEVGRMLFDVICPSV